MATHTAQQPDVAGAPRQREVPPAARLREIHWQRTRNLMVIHLAVWFLFAYLVHWFANDLNSFSFLGFPVGYYMAAQGSLFAFVIQIFVFVKQQDNIDRECGMAEDD